MNNNPNSNVDNNNNKHIIIIIIITTISIRSVVNISCLFLRPRPWQFEIRDSTDR